jgi:hypothetical protein
MLILLLSLCTLWMKLVQAASIFMVEDHPKRWQHYPHPHGVEARAESTSTVIHRESPNSFSRRRLLDGVSWRAIATSHF